MSNLKISSNLFIGQPELNRFQEFMSNDGFKKSMLFNSETFGIIKNRNDEEFKNCKVSADSDLTISGNRYRTIKIDHINGVDKYGNFLSSNEVTQLIVPGNISASGAVYNKWQWVRISHQYSHVEKGVWSISNNGLVAGVGGELKKIARGLPNFPTKIRFSKNYEKYGALLNTGEYDILQLIDNNNCVLNGVTFQEEENLEINVVGTFTYGSPIVTADRLIFNYDSTRIELVEESQNNVAPSLGYEYGRHFYIARVKVTSSGIIIQDKRSDFWESKGSYQLNDIDRLNNILIGVESIKFDNVNRPNDTNIVSVGWGFRSSNWSVNTSQNILTLSSGEGGYFKNINRFNDGNFDGWRVYNPNGGYSYVVSSVKQGNAINLYLDNLDVDDYSQDGGESFLNSEITVVPDAEEIELTFTPNPNSNLITQNKVIVFPIHSGIGKCDVLSYTNISYYKLSYRYKNHNLYSKSTAVLKGEYLNEKSFDKNGALVNAFVKTYNGNQNQYLIEVNRSPNAFITTKINTSTISDVSATSNINVNNAENNYIYFEGDLVLNSNLHVTLSENVYDGNKITIHLNCLNIELGFHKFAVRYQGIEILEIKQGDIYHMKNVDGGITIDFIYKSDRWIYKKNYDTGRPGEMVNVTGIDGLSALTYFDSNGWGNARGFFGYHIANGSNGTTNMSGRFIVGYGSTSPDNGSPSSDYLLPNSTGGEEFHKLTASENAPHSHNYSTNPTQGAIFGQSYLTVNPGTQSGDDVHGVRHESSNVARTSTAESGSGDGHENRPPYVVTLIAQKMY